MKRRTIALALSALITATVLAGCSFPGDSGMDGMGHDTPSPAADADFNAVDEAFAMEIIGHHQQAIEMADIFLTKTGVEPEVLELASNIKAAQQPEVDLTNDWLESWGVELGDMVGMDHGGGMMSDEDMAALSAAAGPEASALFLDQMVAHHQGAIEMAESELDQGQNAEALVLAQKIIEDQTAEIAFMQTLRARL